MTFNLYLCIEKSGAMKKESFSYTEIKEGISNALNKMHKDFLSNGYIQGLSKYQTEYMTRNHLRKLTEMGILSKLRSSKKNMQYEWISDNLDYNGLAEDVLQYSNNE